MGTAGSSDCSLLTGLNLLSMVIDPGWSLQKLDSRWVQQGFLTAACSVGLNLLSICGGTLQELGSPAALGLDCRDGETDVVSFLSRKVQL